MTRHHNKKSFLSQTKYDIQMRARAIEHRRKTTMYGHAQGKIIGEDTMYGHTQGKIIGEDTMYGNAQGKIGEDREDTIYGKYERDDLKLVMTLTTLTSIKLPNILPETFQIVLRYIYGGKFLCMTNFSLFDPYYP
ncbi:BTB/POZ protein [Rhizophagus irregularis DAOM 181602=DAOM 197198]|nr:BTB/POZ protein [Rhizophagus irregularis DAOM 181602=DAOM 197198]